MMITDVTTISLDVPTGRRPLVFAWGISSFYGWGVNGMNLVLSLDDEKVFLPYCAQPYYPADIVLDPLRRERITQVAVRSQPLLDAISDNGNPLIHVDAPLLVAVGRDFEGLGSVLGRRLYGSPTIGVAFLEQVFLSDEALSRARDLAHIIAGSTWNEMLLRGAGIRSVTTVLQGVDTSLFHPGQQNNSTSADRFIVFSGGKLEFRKGQDLVLAAFRAFHRRHPESLLLAAWHSPWSYLMHTAVGHAGIKAPFPSNDSTPDVVGWAVANGIPANAVISVGLTPNIAMPHVIREADVALFPSRAEGGTNLVAMECIACGVPTILSANTGHLDLLQLPDIAYPLTRQTAVRQRDGIDTTDWGESDVDEAIELLEQVWCDRKAAKAKGLKASKTLSGMTWKIQTQKVLRAIDPFL